MFIKPALVPATAENGDPLPDAPPVPLRVMHPGGRRPGRVLRPEGEHVSETDLYWNKRMRHGDVVRAEPPAPEPPTEGASA